MQRWLSHNAAGGGCAAAADDDDDDDDDGDSHDDGHVINSVRRLSWSIYLVEI